MSWLSNNWKRAFNPIGPEIENKLRSDFERWDISGKRAKAQNAAAIEAQQTDIEQSITDLPEYEISDEAKQRLALLQEAGAGLVEGAEEQTDLARMRAGMIEGPGAAQSRRDIEASTAGQVQAIQNIGGAGALGAATQVGLGEQAAYEDLIASNLMAKEQGESALMNALQTKAGMRREAAGLEAQGLEGMIAEKDKVFQSQLQKAQTGLQYDISQLAMDQQARIAKENKKKILGLF